MRNSQVKKPKRLAVTALVLALVASACSSGSTAEGTSGGQTTAADSGDDTSELVNSDIETCDGKIDKDVTIALAAHSGDDAYAQTVDDFNAGPGKELGVTVELVNLGEESYEDFITGAAASNSLPEIIDMDGPFLYNFAWNGFVQPLGNCVSQEKVDEFLPSVIGQGTYEGELYSLGSFDSGMGLWAKKSDLEKVDARIPESSADAWSAEEFTTILKDLETSGVSAPLDIQWSYGAGEFRPYAFASIVQSGGGDLIDRDGYQTADGFLNSQGAVDALTTFQSWVNDGLVDLEAIDDNNFINEDASFSWVGHWKYNDYKEALGEDLILVPLPDFGAGSKTGMGSWNWAMSSAVEDPDAVWAFIDFATQAEQVKSIAAFEGAVPSLLSVLEEDPSFSPGGDRYLYVRNLQASPEVAVPRPQTAAYGFIRNEYSDVFADIVGGADVEETLNQAVENIDADIESNEGYRPAE